MSERPGPSESCLNLACIAVSMSTANLYGIVALDSSLWSYRTIQGKWYFCYLFWLHAVSTYVSYGFGYAIDGAFRW